MIDKIQEVQDELNASPCVFCGKTHHVELRGFGSCVSYSFSEDSCEMFVKHVKSIVSVRCV